MQVKLKAPYVMSALLALLMSLQAVLGLLFAAEYRDAEWIRATWFGNDWVTLLVAVPLLLAALSLAWRDSVRGLLLWLGMLGYGIYNYAFYLFGATLNAFFPLYLVPFVLSVVALILVLARLDIVEVAHSFSSKTPVRIIGGYLVVVAVTFVCVWLGMWAAYIFAGRPTPVESEAFKVVAALDLSVMMPALAAGGILLWRRNAWGFMIASIAGIQGTLYLLLLSVNSAVEIQRGLKEAPGQLPMWGTLGLATGVVTALLLINLGASGDRPAKPGVERVDQPVLGA